MWTHLVSTTKNMSKAMETKWLYPSLFLLVLALPIFKFLLKRFTNQRAQNLPPSPPSLPFIGHLHLLKDPIHRTLQEFSRKFGPVYSLWFGSRLVVVVSSPSTAEECLSKNDLIFANRPRLITGKYMGYNYTSLANAPHGKYWRNLRKISSLELLSPSRLSLSVSIRSDEIKQMLVKLYDSSKKGFVKVELKSVFSELTLNILLRMLAGKRYYGENLVDSEEATRFTSIIKDVFECSGAANPGDFLPILNWVDYGGYEKRVKLLGIKMDGILQGLIEEHRDGRSSIKDEETMIDRLLLMQESEPRCYTDETIKGLLLVHLVAGTDTSSVTLEWAMSLLLNNPETLEKAKSEIDIRVGQDQFIDESVVFGLEYLQNIISETYRMFPAGPLLVPHLSSQECQIGGFDIPCNTMLLVNAWAIQRDPNVWDNPTEFRPERFKGIDVNPYKFLPFGVGRRSCPGTALANRMVSLALGSLIQCFDWRRISDEEVDLTEGKGLSMPKAQPLEALCKARPIMSKIV